MYDVVIVGGGPTGLSAALVLGRARRKVVVVDSGEPRNAAAHESHGFLTRDGVPPGELLRLGRAEVTGYGVEILSDRVVSAVPGFAVTLESGTVLRARKLLVTAGIRDELPDLPGVAELWGDQVHFCPYCHGYEVRDDRVGVVADGPMGVMKAVMLREWAPDVVLFPGDYTPTADEAAQLAKRGIAVEAGKVTGLAVTDGRLTGVDLADGRTVERSAVFVNPVFVPRDTLLRDLGCDLDDQGWVKADSAGRTSVEGVWAAGNVVDPRAQLISSAGAGATAAVQINHDLIFEA
ncbi:NAD(P)/FAD-dependent oxidoreductase [Actinophytocola oryzae]|uniref:Thioredoxin reductase n=1 Tax=Actinophytocola oryzae TaxID=502181 RepID=A0A4R7VUZ9_9PSEU|nr:NAD(P)/FAD-dependent oxidoreductase [Actinophytocola oryzae]TDV53684.1 thioredoxin reductase [Actinophytocola oryzae]